MTGAKKAAVKKVATKKAAAKKKAAKVTHSETTRAHLARDHTKNAVSNFYSAFTTVRTARGAATGAPTDGEQDLLRASLVFAAAGLDNVVKTLIREALRKLAEKDSNVQEEFEKFTQRMLRGKSDDPDTKEIKDSSSFLAKILVSQSPYDTLIENYIYNLTGSSLQSVNELFKAAKALGINENMLRKNKTDLDEAFKIRNQIIHELDVSTSSGGIGKRQRNSRTRSKLEEHSKLLQKVSDHFINEVDKKLSTHA